MTPEVAEDGDEEAEGSKRRNLPQEAESLQHKLTHLPKNPYCSTCCRAKLKHKYTKRGTFQRIVEEWGDIVTADHMKAQHIKAQGFSGEMDAFVIKDIYSGLTRGFPSPNKGTQ